MGNREAYDIISGEWDKNRRQRGIDACIVDFASCLKPDSAVLDVGCGTGYPIAEYLCSRGFEVVGIDISEKMIAHANALNLPHASFLVKDLLDYAPEREFDAVIAFDSLWHIEHKRQGEIYCKIASMLKDGGCFLFTHGKTDGEVTGTMFGQEFCYSALDSEVVKALLEESGFETISLTEDYAEKTTGTRDLLVVARKTARRQYG